MANGFISASALYLKDPIRFMLDKGALLALQQHAGLQAFNAVPHVLGNVGPVHPVFMTQDAGLQDFALVVVGGHPHLALQDDKGLVLGGVVVHGNLGAWLQRVEEAVALVIKALVKVMVHPQPR